MWLDWIMMNQRLQLFFNLKMGKIGTKFKNSKVMLKVGSVALLISKIKISYSLGASPMISKQPHQKFSNFPLPDTLKLIIRCVMRMRRSTQTTLLLASLSQSKEINMYSAKIYSESSHNNRQLREQIMEAFRDFPKSFYQKIWSFLELKFAFIIRKL